MVQKLLWLCFCLSVAVVSGRLLTPEEMQKVLLDGESMNFMAEYDQHRSASPRKNYGYNFNCPTLDVGPPKDIHSLSPKYVSVMAALGDSLTAANGAKAQTLPGVALQYRGVSFPIGGDGELENTLTLPNVIRKYNPDIFGPSKRMTFLGFEAWSALDVGVPGAKAKDMPKQATMLIKRLAEQKHKQYNDGWKVVTMFIGANDVCDCKNQDPDELVKQWISSITEALDILAANLTNTFVNLVNVIDVGGLRIYEQYYPMCRLTHQRYCPCNIYNDKRHNDTSILIRKYQQAMYDVTKKYQERTDFTVVVQPFTENVVVPMGQKIGQKEKPDLSLLAPDCFHFSQWGHATGAAYLWNSMLTPLQKKQNIIDPLKIELMCPDLECPYFRTAANSVSCTKPTTS